LKELFYQLVGGNVPLEWTHSVRIGHVTWCIPK
jgi:hypothetical protein